MRLQIVGGVLNETFSFRLSMHSMEREALSLGFPFLIILIAILYEFPMCQETLAIL